MSRIDVEANLKTSGFKAGLDSMRSSVQTASTEIQKKFSGKELFKGFAQGLGIGSVQQIADLIVAPFRLAAEYSKQMADNSARATSALMRTLTRNRTDEQNLEALNKDQARLSQEMEDKKAELARLESAGVAATVGAALLGGKEKLKAEIEQLKAAWQEKYDEVDALSKKIAKDQEAADTARVAANMKAEEAAFEASLKRMTNEEAIYALASKRSQVEGQITDLENSKGIFGFSAEQANSMYELTNKRASLEERIAALQEKISKEMEKQQAITEEAGGDDIFKGGRLGQPINIRSSDFGYPVGGQDKLVSLLSEQLKTQQTIAQNTKDFNLGVA